MIWLWMGVAAAESWCAGPLVAHEWGVAVLAAEPQTLRPDLPSWLHHEGAGASTAEPVRTMAPDHGERDLPVVHFYRSQGWSDAVPVAVEVGFARGDATAWFPAVSSRTPATQARSAAARAARERLVAQRAEPGPQGRDLGPDPTRQLHWDRLVLSSEPLSVLRDPEVGWVTAAREVPEALWVNGPGESERFLFYEGDTTESSALVIERGGTHPTDHFVLRNVSAFDVFDVVFVHQGRAWTAPRIPAGKTAGFLLQEAFDPVATRQWLTDRWVDLAGVPAVDWEACVMMRDPALPLEHAQGHRLFPAELDVLWGAWEGRLLGPQGTRLLYREAPEALDTVMPISLYTDMFHDPQLRRLGVVLVPDPPLP